MLYLFLINDTVHEVDCVSNIKQAIWELAKYTGDDNDLFQKCLKGFESDDVDGVISLYNRFAYYTICKVYVIEKKLYDVTKGGVIT